MRRTLALAAFAVAALVGNIMFDNHDQSRGQRHDRDCDELNNAYKAASYAWEAGPTRPYLIRPGESSAEHLARIFPEGGPYLDEEEFASEMLRLHKELTAARDAYQTACS